MCLFPCLLSSILKIFESIVSHWIFILSSSMVFHLDYMLHVWKRSSNLKNSPFYGHLPWIRVLGFWGLYLGVCVKFVDEFKVIWFLIGLLIWICLDPRSFIDERIVLEVYDCPLSILILHLSCMTSNDHNLVIPCLLELILLSH